MIGVIDYGMGNLRSVAKAIEKVGGGVKIVTAKEDIRNIDKMVLPGVGAFRDAKDHLDELDMSDEIIRFIESGKPFLGICLGLQLLFDVSYEDGVHKGFSLFKGEVVNFKSVLPENSGLKIPHMGWNSITYKKECPYMRDIKEDTYFYFVHSYFVAPEDDSIVLTTTRYGVEFVSSICTENIIATQFHPEKSQKAGLALLNDFVHT